MSERINSYRNAGYSENNVQQERKYNGLIIFN